MPDGRRGPLARKGAAGPKVGQYGVDVEGFERLALPTLGVDDDDDTIYVLDEIGRMELKSEAFATRVEELARGGCASKIARSRAITAPIYARRVLRPRRDARRRRAQARKVDARRRHGGAARSRRALARCR